MLRFLSHYHCHQNNSQTLLGLLWLCRPGSVLHNVLMTRWMKVSFKTFAACDFLSCCTPLPASFHCVFCSLQRRNSLNTSYYSWLMLRTTETWVLNFGFYSVGDCCEGVHMYFLCLCAHMYFFCLYSHDSSLSLRVMIRGQNILNGSNVILLPDGH